MLCASFHHPHEPFLPPQEFWDMYEGADIEIPQFPAGFEAERSMMDRNLNAYHGISRWDLRDADGLRRLHRAYYGLVSYLDRKVGALLAALEESGQADNTVVVFTSDHGDMLCQREMVQKRCFYDWSCKVPLIVRFPDGWRAGSRVATPVSLIDLLPTFCQLAGVEELLPHDGASLLPIIEGQQAERTIFAQAHEAVGMPCIMARQGDFKYNYIHGYEPQLFNVAADPNEWTNLAGDGEHSQIEAQLRQAVLDRFDPDAIAAANLASLYRRRLIRDVMSAQGRSWCHFPQFDANKNSVEQYLS